MSIAFVAGIDAGGTGSRVTVQSVRDDAEERSADGPGANLQVLGVNGTAKVLYELLLDVQPEARAHVAVVAGVAGAGRAADRTALASALARRLGVDAGRVEVVSDVELALDAAFGTDEAGMVIVAGTGSIVTAREAAGDVVRAGGWGRVLGDQGSGYAIGRDGLAAVADALDGGPATRLVDEAAAWGAGDAAALVAAVYRDERNPASFAPRVLDAWAAGDAVARAIVENGAAALARQASWVADRCAILPPRYALWGGLTGHDGYRDLLVRSLAHALPDWARVTVEHTPVEAALERARQSAASRG